MSKVTLITDSTAYIPQNLVERYKIHVTPQVLVWGDETFRDGVDILPDDFYKRLAKTSVMPSTSQASPADFEKLFNKLLADGQSVLAVLISSKLSGTISSANQAWSLLDGRPVSVIDSNTTAMALGFLVLKAARAAEKGASLEECKALVESQLDRVGAIFCVDTLEFLYRGGRIGGATRLLGTALNIKPILELVDGAIEPAEKVRTRRKAQARMVELLGERTGGKPLRVCAIHANAQADAQNVLEEVIRKYKVVEGLVSDVSPVVGTHVGPGTVGITYMIED